MVKTKQPEMIKIKALKTMDCGPPINVDGKPLPMGEVRDIEKSQEVENLLRVGYIEQVKEEKKEGEKKGVEK